MKKVLVATRESTLERMLKVTLTINGYSVVITKSLKEAQAIIGNGKIDILLLDTHLTPGENVLFLSKLRENRLFVLVLFLGEPLLGLEKNVFLSTPFEFCDLKVKMNQLFRKHKSLPEKVIIYGDLNIDVTKKVVTIKNKILHLGMVELAMLISLARKTGKVVEREILHQDLEAQGLFFNTTLQHHLWGLKNKIREAAGEKIQIKKVIGQGLRLLVTG